MCSAVSLWLFTIGCDAIFLPDNMGSDTGLGHFKFTGRNPTRRTSEYSVFDYVWIRIMRFVQESARMMISFDGLLPFCPCILPPQPTGASAQAPLEKKSIQKRMRLALQNSARKGIVNAIFSEVATLGNCHWVFFLCLFLLKMHSSLLWYPISQFLDSRGLSLCVLCCLVYTADVGENWKLSCRLCSHIFSSDEIIVLLWFLKLFLGGWGVEGTLLRESDE